MRKHKSTKNVIERFRTDRTRVCIVHGPQVPVSDKYLNFERGVIHVSNELVFDILSGYCDNLNVRPHLSRILRKGFHPAGVDFTATRTSGSHECGVVRCDRLIFIKSLVHRQKTRKPKYHQRTAGEQVARRIMKEHGL